MKVALLDAVLRIDSGLGGIHQYQASVLTRCSYWLLTELLAQNVYPYSFNLYLLSIHFLLPSRLLSFALTPTSCVSSSC